MNKSFAGPGNNKILFWNNKFSVLKLSEYSYNMMTSYMSKPQGKCDFSVYDPFKADNSNVSRFLKK